MRNALVLAVFFACLASFGFSQTQARIDRTFSVEAPPTIVVRNEDGRTHFTSHDADRVVVRATKEVTGAKSREEAERRAAEVDVRIEQTGDRVEVRTLYPKTRWISWDGVSVLVHLAIEAPRRSDLDVRSEDGEVVIDGLDGAHRVHVEDGRLEITDSSGRFEIQAEDGDVRLVGVRGDVTVVADDGDLTLHGVLNALYANADDGTVEIRVLPDSEMTSDWNVQAEDGSVRIELPDGFAAELDLRVGDGRIDVDSPVKIRSSSDGHMSSTLNGGGRTLEVRTDDGSIRIR